MEDDDVVCVDPVDDSIKVPEANKDLYNFVLVRVSIKQIEVTPHPIRGLSADHKGKMQDKILENGYASTPSAGHISVSLKNVDTTGRSFKSLQVIPDDVWLVDGRHRYKVLEELVQKRKEWEPKCSSMPVYLVFRTDGKPLEMMEILSLGAQFNEVTGTVKRVDLADFVHAAVSSSKTLSSRLDVDLNTIEPTALAGALYRMKILGSLQIKQVTRYAKLALKLCRSEKCKGKFFSVAEQCSLLGISHVCHKSLVFHTKQSLYVQ